ncbi:hypothetical protein PTKIN_Ptkin08bG0179200 [Pterospermum kingtungense]
MELSSTQAHIALLSSPSHLTPMVELGKCLVTNFQNVKVTIFVTTFLESAPTMSRMVQSVQSGNQLFDVIQLPPPDISGLIDPTQPGIASVLAVPRASKPAFRSAISALKTPPTALIVYVYAVDCLEIADELKIPKFVFTSSNAWYLVLIIYCPILDDKAGGVLGEDDDHQYVLPGCTPVRAGDLPDPLLVQTKTNCLEFIRMAKEIPKADGILVNTWEELQPKTLAALRDEKLLASVARAPIYPIGPVTADATSETSKTELFEWMDKQPKESVLYISFGSMGVLSLEQMTELAWGLQLSQQRFIWVVRPPAKNTGVDFKNPKFGDTNDMFIHLPEGFMARTQGRGVVVPNWAPQVEILSHPSCGGFFTHSGWNSTIECVTNGLPMIAWPLYAEQRMNATLITEELGIAVRSTTIPSKGVVGREEIEAMVKKIFVDEEGRKIRERVKEFKRSAEKAWTKGGSSYNALADMVKQCSIMIHA